MQTSRHIVHRQRAMRRALKAATAIFILGTASAAQADTIALIRFINANESFPFAISGQAAAFTFDVDIPPVPGPILKHGVQHYYSSSLVQVTYITASNDITKVFATPQDLGLMTKAVKVNQAFTIIELLEAFKPATSLKKVSIEVDDFYKPAVPEPAQWMLMICGFAMTGTAMRRHRVGPRPAIGRA